MRIIAWTVAILGLWVPDGLRAEAPVFTQINRFFGVGWGDGYHVGWNDCMGGNLAGAGYASCPLPTGIETKEQVPSPAAKPIPVPSAQGALPEHTGNARSRIWFISQPERPAIQKAVPLVNHSAPAVAIPRLVRLPPVAGTTFVSQRLPPVTNALHK